MDEKRLRKLANIQIDEAPNIRSIVETMSSICLTSKGKEPVIRKSMNKIWANFRVKDRQIVIDFLEQLNEELVGLKDEPESNDALKKIGRFADADRRG